MKRCARPILMPRWCLIPRISHIARPDFFCSILAILFALFMPAPSSHAAGKDLLRLENQSETDILNIRVTAGKKDFFLRLDLAPNDSDEVENPDLVANLRVDYGLFFLFYEKVPLPDAVALVFCSAHADCLSVDLKDGKSLHLQGKRQDLVPEENSRPVCELSRFTPGMTMADVCSILEKEAPKDDNGAVIAGLGFDGQLWAARLYPGKGGLLEHLELRRPLEFADLKKLLESLWKNKYVPWQAELPGLDVDFAEMSQKDTMAQWNFLDGALDNFLKDRKGEATVMFAPAGSLPLLADSDAPARDVQLFTLTLRPKSNLMLLDVAAYKGTGKAKS